MINYFENVENLQDLRKEYHRLAFINHPDRGGETVIMQLINNQYDKLSMKLISSNDEFSEGRKEWEMEVSEEIRRKLDRIIFLPEVSIELIGSWIWVTGNTFAVRDTLKEQGFIFSHSKSAWYYHKGDYFKKSGVLLSMDEMRNLWGHEKIASETCEQIN